MKIVHICLAASYVEGFGYQENILTQLHAQMGHSVTVLTTDRTFNSKYERTIREKFDYVFMDPPYNHMLEKEGLTYLEK